MKIEFQHNFEKLTGLCQKIKKAGGNLEVPLKRFGAYFQRQIDTTFDRQGAREGHPPWQPLSAMTLAMRRKGKSPGSPLILENRGYLRQSFSYNLLSGNKGVEVGTNVPYAIKHQLGDTIPSHPEQVRAHKRRRDTTKGRFKSNVTMVREFTRQAPERKIPIRQMIFITENDKQMIPSIFINYFNEIIQ